MKRNEVRSEKTSKTFPLMFCCIQVVRFVSTLSKLKAKGRDWKSTLLSEVASSNLTFSITVISLITVTLPHNSIQGAWKVESERGSEGGASLFNGEEHPTIKDKEPAIQQPASNGVKNPKKPGAAAKKAQMAQQRTKQSQKI